MRVQVLLGDDALHAFVSLPNQSTRVVDENFRRRFRGRNTELAICLTHAAYSLVQSEIASTGQQLNRDSLLNWKAAVQKTGSFLTYSALVAERRASLITAKTKFLSAKPKIADIGLGPRNPKSIKPLDDILA